MTNEKQIHEDPAAADAEKPVKQKRPVATDNYVHCGIRAHDMKIGLDEESSSPPASQGRPE